MFSGAGLKTVYSDEGLEATQSGSGFFGASLELRYKRVVVEAESSSEV